MEVKKLKSMNLIQSAKDDNDVYNFTGKAE